MIHYAHSSPGSSHVPFHDASRSARPRQKLGLLTLHFSCHGPKDLIDYLEAQAHGNAFGERRIVLDTNQQSYSSTTRMVDPAKLLNTVLECITSQRQPAASVGEIIIFYFCSCGK